MSPCFAGTETKLPRFVGDNHRPINNGHTLALDSRIRLYLNIYILVRIQIQELCPSLLEIKRNQHYGLKWTGWTNINLHLIMFRKLCGNKCGYCFNNRLLEQCDFKVEKDYNSMAFRLKVLGNALIELELVDFRYVIEN